MEFTINVRCGFEQVDYALDPLVVVQRDIDHVGQFAGSYHVLEMGQHFRDYVEQGNMPAFPNITGFPESESHEPLINKQRAQGVTGNIGEAIAGIVAERVLDIPSNGIAHIRLQRPFQRRKCPDFLIRTDSKFPKVIADLARLKGVTRCPIWWPLESKARVDGNQCDAAVSDAFRQLAAYWYTIAHGSHSCDVGYGLVVTCAYERRAGVCLRVFIPNDVGELQAYLTSFAKYEDFVDKMVVDDLPVRKLVYG